MVKNYADLTVWQKAMDLTAQVYELTKRLPKEEIYGITSQMRRAAISIPSNIAEGHERHSRKEFTHFISIAQGSKAELETQLLLCVRIGYFADTDISDILNLLQEVGKMLTTLAGRLRE
jgi:four helix bundle protein